MLAPKAYNEGIPIIEHFIRQIENELLHQKIKIARKEQWKEEVNNGRLPIGLTPGERGDYEDGQ